MLAPSGESLSLFLDMTKEELEKYAHENRKRLDAQEVKIGDVVKVLRGRFAGETGVIVGIIVCGRDYADPYYEVDMDCEVPDKHKCRKNTLAQPNNVIGGLSAYEFEVIGNRAPMQSTEEIKVGDKVRVREDAPIHIIGSASEIECKAVVLGADADIAVIGFRTQEKQRYDAYKVPTKYLIKVDAEAKEPKFKAGEIVRYRYDGKLYIVECKTGKYYYTLRRDGGDIMMHDALESDLELVTEPKQGIKVGDRVCCYNALHLKGSQKEDYMGYVTSITDIGITIQLDKGGLVLVYHESDLELVQPKEQTGVEENDADNIVDEIGRVVEGYCKSLANLADSFDWQRYEADLAKEIAVKVANKYSDPEEAAGYAVSVAKAVVENLKKK